MTIEKGNCTDIFNKYGKENMNRGSVWMVDLGEGVGSEQSGCKPCVVIQNNTGNEFSTTVIVAVITSKCKKQIPTHITLDMFYKSTVMAEQIRTVDKKRLKSFIANINMDKMLDINKSLDISLDLR